MKTFIDKSNAASVTRYLKLFDMANKALENYPEKAPKDKEGNILQISSLEQYFTCIGTLKSIDPKFAYLLPLDESFFEIDVNTRSIKVPNEFSKGVGVQGDVIAETLLFKVNRFVDAKDLNDATNIWILWQYGPVGAPTSEGVFKVGFRYINYDPNYLVFAWPLAGKVTKEYGTLRFSVRFETPGGQGEGATYSLNTLPAVITINPALKADLGEDFPYEETNILFDAAIQDSQQTATPPEEAAEKPNFNYDKTGPLNKYLRDKAYLFNDELHLTAQATVGDEGYISYSWAPTSNDVKLGATYIKTKDSSRVNRKRYYTKSTANEVETYHLYGDDVVNGKTEDGADLYEYFAYLDVEPNGGDIAGTYILNATNRIGWSSTSTAGSAAVSNADGYTQTVVIPKPEVLEFKENGNLPLGAFITGEDRVNLEVNIQYDDLSKIEADPAKIEYVWERTTDSPEILEADRKWVPVVYEVSSGGVGQESAISTVNMNIDEFHGLLEDENISVIGQDLPGWYKAIITSTINRASETITTQECKVTREPVEPELNHPFTDEEDGGITLPAETGTTVEAVLSILNFEDSIENPLKSDQLSYQWYTSDDELIEDKCGILTKDNIENGNIVIRTQFKAEEYAVAYYCKVTNALNGHDVTSISGYYIVI